VVTLTFTKKKESVEVEDPPEQMHVDPTGVIESDHVVNQSIAKPVSVASTRTKEEWKIELEQLLDLERKPMKLSGIIQQFEENDYDNTELWPDMTDAELATFGVAGGLLKRWRKVHTNPESVMASAESNLTQISTVEYMSGIEHTEATNSKQVRYVMLTIHNYLYNCKWANLRNPLLEKGALQGLAEKFGIDVNSDAFICRENLDQDGLMDIHQELEDIVDSGKGSIVPVIYYSGHGANVGGDKFTHMISTDGYSLSSNLFTHGAFAETHPIIMLDCCREYCTKKTMKKSRGAKSASAFWLYSCPFGYKTNDGVLTSEMMLTLTTINQCDRCDLGCSNQRV